MDISQIADQVIEHVKQAPEKVRDVIADPKGTIEGITGQSLDDVDLGEIVEKVKDGLEEAGIDVAGFIGSAAENVGDAVKGMLDNLFGGADK